VELAGEWRRMSNEKLVGLYTLLSYIRAVKLMRIKLIGMWNLQGEENAYRNLIGKRKERDHFEDQDLDGDNVKLNFK
jgi:hypothetical protein